MTKRDIHNYKRRIKCALNRINTGDLPESNKKDLYEFYEFLNAEGISIGRIAKYLNHLLKIGKWLEKPFIDAGKKDIIELVRKIENKDYAAHTKHDYKIIIKRYFKWLRDTEDYPDEVKWIKSTIKDSNIRIPEELINEEDAKKLIGTAKHPRNKAMVAFLYESGCRVGELLCLRIKDITFDENGATAILNGKTGMRKIRVISSVPYLSTWIENHPNSDDPDSCLWVSIGTRYGEKPIIYQTFRIFLHKLAKKAGIKKKVNPHAFRHSRATHMANHLTEAQMNNYFGWVQGSKMAGTYVHLSGRDMDNAILKMNGLKKEEKNVEDKFKPKRCSRCEKVNPPTGKFCLRCGLPLTLETAIQYEDKRKNLDNLMSSLMKDPEVQNFLIQKLSQSKITV